MRNPEMPYWATIKLSPDKGSLQVFVRREDRESFLANLEANIAVLNREAETVCNYWNYKPHFYSAGEINVIDGPIAGMQCTSGAANVAFVFSVISQVSENPPQVLEPQKVLQGLCKWMSLVCGYNKGDSIGVKRKAYEMLPNKEGAKRNRRSDGFR